MESNKKSNLIPIYVLLFIILVILVAGLFKQELTLAILLYGPHDETVYKTVNYTCKQEKYNPEHDKATSEVREKCAAQRGPLSLNPLVVLQNDYQQRMADEIKCVKSGLEKVENSGIPERITVDSTCTKTVGEIWFSFLGKSWFKKGERTT